MSDTTQALMRANAQPDMDEPSAAALTWYYRNVLFFEHAFHRDPRVALLFYEDLVRDPTARICALCDFIDLPGCGPWMTRFVHTRSVGKAQAPQLLPGVEAACAGLMDRFSALPRL